MLFYFLCPIIVEEVLAVCPCSWSDCPAVYRTLFLTPTSVGEIKDERLLLKEVQNTEKSVITSQSLRDTLRADGNLPPKHSNFLSYFNTEQVTDKILFDFWLFFYYIKWAKLK